MPERLADALRHGSHLLRQGGRDSVHPGDQLRQRHGADLIQAESSQAQGPGPLREPCAAAVGAYVLFQKALHPLHALFVLDFVQRIQDRSGGAVIGEIQFSGGDVLRVFGLVENVFLHHRAVIDDLLLLVAQFSEGHIGPHPHGPAHVCHQRPHQAVPGRHSPFIDGQALVGDQARPIHRPHCSGASAAFAGAAAVEGQILRADDRDRGSTHRAAHVLLRREVHRRRDLMPVRAPIDRQPGEHEPQTVEQFRHRAEGAADPGYAGSLMQRQGRRHVAHLVHLGLCGLGHSSPGIGGQGFQIAAGALRVQDPQGQRRLSRSGHAGDPHDLMQRDIHIHVFQIVYTRSPNLDFLRSALFTAHGFVSCSSCISWNILL